MNYYLDTEFLEGTQKKTFLGIPYSNTPNTIDLISIGIICEDGREYYSISKDFNLKEAWNRYDLDYGHGDQRNKPPRKIYWIRENVLKPIFCELTAKINQPITPFNFTEFKKSINRYGKSNKQIAFEIMQFTLDSDGKGFDNWLGCTEEYINALKTSTKLKPKFYAYYADYDWVSFCWLFGKMIDLPKGFPMYCRDLKQMLDGKYMHQEHKYNGVSRLDAWLKHVKKYPDFPKQENEHNALDDAKWNMKLHNFLKDLK